MKTKGFGLILMLMLVSACAPVVYDTTHYKRQAPVRHVNVQTTHTHVYRSHVEVTLYAENNYRGVYFQPIQLVIADGQYVEIPIRNRRGQHTRIYAHYHEGELHFDSSRSCKRIPGSRGFRYTKNWDNGHKFGHINAGKDYDLTGLRLQVRSLPTGRNKVKQFQPSNKSSVHNDNGIRYIKQDVASTHSKNKGIQAVVYERQHPTNVTVDKVLINNEKSAGNKHISTIITTNRPVIVEKVNLHEEAKRVAKTSQGNSGNNRADLIRTAKNQAEAVVKHKNVSDNEPRKRIVSKKLAVSHEVVARDKRGANTEAQGNAGSALMNSVKISLVGGTVTVNGKQGKFGKKNLTLKDGESREVTLVAKGGIKIKVPISYRNGMLAVASNGKPFKSDASWINGKTYKINTQGTSHLENMQMTVIAL